MAKLGEILIEQGKITQQQLESALSLQVSGERKLGYILTQMKLITSKDLASILSKQFNITELTKIIVNDNVLKLIPKYICKNYGVCPISFKGTHPEIEDESILIVAMTNPLDETTIVELEENTGKAIMPVYASQELIDSSIDKYIKFGMNDLKNPKVLKRMNIALFILVSILAASFTTIVSKVMYENKYGVVTSNEGYTTYSNDDLILAYDGNNYTLSGRGMYAKGIFTVSFQTVDKLNEFINSKTHTFSDKQLKWIHYIIEKKLTTK